MLKKIAFGTVLFGFLISPPITNPDSAPLNANIKIKHVSPICLIVGDASQYKLLILMSLKPKKKQLLTERQLEIVEGIVSGKSYKMITTDLFVSIDTIRSHIKNIYKTLEINCKAELIKKSFNKEL